MKRIIGIGLLALASLGAQAQNIGGPPFIAVHGKARMETVPDVFPLTITLRETSTDAARTQALIEGHAERILQIAREMRLPDADVSATNLSVSPEYRYDRETEKQVFLGNAYQRQVTLRLRKLQQLADVVGKLPDAKEVRVSTGAFESSRADELRRQLVASAVQDARRTGEAMATAVGRRLGPVHNVSNRGFNLRYVEGAEPPVIFDSPSPMDVPAAAPGSRARIALREGTIELNQDVYVLYTLVD